MIQTNHIITFLDLLCNHITGYQNITTSGRLEWDFQTRFGQVLVWLSEDPVSINIVNPITGITTIENVVYSAIQQLANCGVGTITTDGLIQFYNTEKTKLIEVSIDDINSRVTATLYEIDVKTKENNLITEFWFDSNETLTLNLQTDVYKSLG